MENLLCAIKSECRALGYSYPTDSYTIFYNSRPLEFYSSLSDIPNECTLELQELSTYPAVTLMEITIATIKGIMFNIDVTGAMVIERIKNIIQEEEGIPSDQQRLVFKGKQLEDDLIVNNYNIQHGSKVH